LRPINTVKGWLLKEGARAYCQNQVVMILLLLLYLLPLYLLCGNADDDLIQMIGQQHPIG